MPVEDNAWTTLVAVKRHLKIDALDTEHDTELEELINASYLLLEGYIHHPLKSATYTEDYDGDATNTLILRKYPIISITSIHDDTARAFGADTLVPATDYVLDNEEEVGAVRLFQNTSIFTRGIKNVRVVYVAGYATIPADAARACILLVAWLFNRAGSESIVSQALGGKSESYVDDLLPLYIKQLVNRFKEYCV